MASIKGLSSVFPKHKVFQEEIKEIGRKLFSSKIQFKKMEKVYDNSGVKTRYLTEKLDWYLEEHNWSERNFLFNDILQATIIPIKTASPCIILDE